MMGESKVTLFHHQPEIYPIVVHNLLNKKENRLSLTALKT